MRFLNYRDDDCSTFPVCFLVPQIYRDEIQREYITPFQISPDEVIVIDLHFSRDSKKTSATEMKRYLTEELVPELEALGVQHIAVSDAEYFKVLTKANKAEASIGYVLDSVFGNFKVVYVPSFKQVFRDPEKIRGKIALSLNALCAHRSGNYVEPGKELLQFYHYPKDDVAIRDWLQRLLDMDTDLSCDIEGFGLKHTQAGIGTIAFAWSQHEGIAFCVDYEKLPEPVEGSFGKRGFSRFRRQMLKEFFEEMHRRGRKIIWHNIAYDAYVLIYQLWMIDILDTEGLLAGMEILLSRWDCTKLITYLATNSCAGNKLSLKEQAQEFAGNYGMGEDIKNICKIAPDTLLEYNLVDACSTWFVYHKHWKTLIADQQLSVYEDIFKPATLDIIQMQLTGLPVNMKRVAEVKELLEADHTKAHQAIQSNPLVQQFTYHLNERWVEKRNQELKKKRVTLDDAKEVFNPDSSIQLQALLYEQLGLPVLAKTDAGQPSTQAETLKDLRNHTEDKEILDLLDSLLDLGAVSVILETFIPALESAVEGPDGWHYLFGNFNLGGTLSGRLSSSKPNLQNLPAGAAKGTKKGLYGEWIKSCIQAPIGWIFCGLDFNALEDRISALTTKDPNKLKVYIDGYDGHSLRAYAYYGEQMPDIDASTVEGINSIAKKYKPLRDKSKNPTFTLTYQGTWRTLVTKYKFTEELALKVERRYHELYKVSDDWVAAKLDEACKTGYVTVAFGLRVRTPLLAQVIRKTKATPAEAEAEGRSAGNALGQSWCLLNSRAASEFMGKVRKSPHRLTIRPCAQIHDAQYYLIRDEMAEVLYTNEHLVKAVQWQDHPDIWHEQVKLGGELSLFWPNWSKEITIPNGASEAQIEALIQEAMSKHAQA